MEKKAISHHDLKQFTGDLDRYRHWLNGRVLYTPGIKFLIEQADAFWLLDIIATHFGTKQMVQAMARDARLKDMQFWRLDVQPNGSATVSACADSGEEPFLTHHLSYTDFPLEYVDIWAGYDGLNWTLYLPSEH